jgi:protein tyrosine phosphatase (PTP) superfamily phosphohydrolase (DUF442 family)
MNALLLVLQITSANPDSVLNTIRNYVRVSDRLGTSGQIDSTHIQTIADEGFEVVINLATASAERNGTEGLKVAEAGMTYINIPVAWESPSYRDLEMFFSVMKANEDRKVFVHCFANMRASAFTYLYRTLVLGVDPEAADEAMAPVWDPRGDERYQQWGELIRIAASRGSRN